MMFLDSHLVQVQIQVAQGAVGVQRGGGQGAHRTRGGSAGQSRGQGTCRVNASGLRVELGLGMQGVGCRV
jgi:hypothetical protein